VYQAESPDIAPRYKFRRIYFQRTRYTDIYLIHTKVNSILLITRADSARRCKFWLSRVDFTING